jgi:hypothetical protein
VIVSCAGARLCGSQRRGRPGASVRRHASRESPVSSPDARGAAGGRIPPRRTSPRSPKRWGRFRSTFPKPLRQAATPARGTRPARRRSSLSSRRLSGAHSSVIANSHDHAVDATVGTVAKHASRVGPADACFRDCISVAWQPPDCCHHAPPAAQDVCVAPLAPGHPSEGGQAPDGSGATDALPLEAVLLHLDTDVEPHRLSHGPGDAAVSRASRNLCRPLSLS